jgi:ribosomal protein S18 acetylase RimI-like enzyme
MDEIKKATIEDYNDLLPLVIDFELDKEMSSADINKINKQKLMRECKKNLKQFLKDKTCLYLISKKMDKYQGYIFVSFDETYSSEGFVLELYVIPEERKKGIAKSLLINGLAWLKENNCKEIYLTVHKKNSRAIDIYTKQGFKEYEDSYMTMRLDK